MNLETTEQVTIKKVVKLSKILSYDFTHRHQAVIVVI